VKYQPPYGPNWPNVVDPNASYVNGNPAEGIQGSIPPAQSIEYPMREIVNTITKGGYIPSDADLFQLTRGVRRAAYAFATDTGSQNSLSIALDPALLSYEQGLEVRVLCAWDNTGPCTIRVNGLNTQQIVRKDGASLSAGDIRQGGVAVMVYDGGRFQLVSGLTGSVSIGSGWYNGADWIVDTGPPNHLAGTPPIVPVSYNAGMGFSVYVGHNNTTACDINVAALGIRPILLPNGRQLSLGDIVQNMVIRIVYDGTNFVMTSKIHMEIIDAPITMIVGPNVGADFANLNVAMEWVSRRKIDEAGWLTLQMQGSTAAPALKHTYSAMVSITQAQGAKITIKGSGLFGSAPSAGSFTSASWGGAQWYSDAAANLAMLRNTFKTEIAFTSANGIGVSNATSIHLQDLLVTGPGINGPNGTGVWCGSASALFFNTVASAYWGSSNWSCDSDSAIIGQNFYSVGCALFDGVSHNSTLVASADTSRGGGGVCICQHGVDGLQVTFGSAIHFDVSQANGGPRIYGCNNIGINHWGSSSIHCNFALLDYMGYGGISTVESICAFTWGNISNSNNFGFLVSTGGNMDCSNCVTAAIAGLDYQAAHGAYMYAAGFQNGSAQFSPARNTWGNGNAYIEG
jgi:hypothetical protein